MIIDRYIRWELIKTTVAIFIVLVFVGLADQLASLLDSAASGEFPIHMVMSLLLYTLPNLTSMLLPFAFFLSIVLTFSRFYSNSEMIIFFASGLTWGRLAKLCLQAGFGLMLFSLVNNLVIVPRATTYQDNLLRESRASLAAYVVMPGKFQEVGGRFIFYTEAMDKKTGTANDVFIAEMPRSNALMQDDGHRYPSRVITGREAKREYNLDNDSDYLVIRNGHSYETNLNDATSKQIQFREYGVRLSAQKKVGEQTLQGKGSLELWRDPDLSQEAIAELQWRYSAPFAFLVIALLAIPFGQSDLRRGRNWKAFVSIIVIIVYTSGMLVAKNWLAEGLVPNVIGIWWIHALALVLALVMLGFISGWFRIAKNKLK